MSERRHDILDIMYLFIGVVLIIFMFVAFYITYIAVFDQFFLFLLIPVSGVLYYSISFIFKRSPLIYLHKLAVFNKIIFSLYLTALTLLLLIVINPASEQSFWLYYIVLTMLHYFYPLLWIPLIIVILLTLYYLKLNMPLEKKKLAEFILSLTVIIGLFFGIYILLNISMGPLSEFYRSIINQYT